MKIKDLKVYSKIIVPYVLCAGVVVGSNKLLGNGYPFISDMVDYDYIQNVYCFGDDPYQYKKQGNVPENNELFLYSEWKHDYIDEDYKRTVDYYENVNYPHILELLEFDNLDTKDILGVPDKTHQESRKRMDEFDFLVNRESYRYVTYTDEQGKTLESREKNVKTSMQKIFEFGLLSSIVTVCMQKKKKLSIKK